MIRAIPPGRAGRPTARAMLRCLGYSATIAIAGCTQADPKQSMSDAELSAAMHDSLAAARSYEHELMRRGYSCVTNAENAVECRKLVTLTETQ